jgi:hypothetical protein
MRTAALLAAPVALAAWLWLIWPQLRPFERIGSAIALPVAVVGCALLAATMRTER